MKNSMWLVDGKADIAAEGKLPAEKWQVLSWSLGSANSNVFSFKSTGKADSTTISLVVAGLATELARDCAKGKLHPLMTFVSYGTNGAKPQFSYLMSDVVISSYMTAPPETGENAKVMVSVTLHFANVDYKGAGGKTGPAIKFQPAAN